MTIVNNNIENLKVVENNKKEEVMNNRRNLLFIEGNRTEINKANVVESYNKIKAWGFIETMPIEYFPMEEAKNKLGGRKLYKPNIVRKKGEGFATISNFEIKMVEVQEADYDKYDGVCGDGQHRTIALMFDELKDITATYQPVKLSNEKMDIVAYISILYATMAENGLMMIFMLPIFQQETLMQTISLIKGKKAISLHSFSTFILLEHPI